MGLKPIRVGRSGAGTPKQILRPGHIHQIARHYCFFHAVSLPTAGFLNPFFTKFGATPYKTLTSGFCMSLYICVAHLGYEHGEWSLSLPPPYSCG